jgi:hypothetical protein
VCAVIVMKATWTDDAGVRWQQVMNVSELEVESSKLHNTPEALALAVAKIKVARCGGCAGGITVQRSRFV